MGFCRVPLFRKRQFAADVIVTCVRWYLRFSLSLRDVEELMAERGVSVDYRTVWRWTQRYAPEVQCGLRGQLKPKGLTWHMDETHVRIAGRWMYLFRAVDSGGQTVDFYLSETRDREATECFPKRALANPDNRVPHVFVRDRLRSDHAAIREMQREGQLRHSCRQHRTRRYSNNRIESDHRHSKRRLRSMHGPRSLATACAVLAGYRSGTDDSQRASAGDYQKEPAWTGLGLRQSARSQLALTKPPASLLSYSMLLQYFRWAGNAPSLFRQARQDNRDRPLACRRGATGLILGARRSD